MPQSYERLSSLDASFLALETRTTHMHVAGVSVFEAGPLRTDDGGVDIARIRRFVESRLQYIPRYRQRLAWIPIERHPVWIDDEHFNLDYHVRHTSLPHPGSPEQLKHLAGRIISQQLDRQKPLWEMWVVEGLEGDRFALISKIHHAMIDGVAGAGIMAAVLNVMPTSEIEEPDPWTPNPPPSDVELVASEITRRIADSFDRVRNARRAMDDTRQVVTSGLRRARAVYYSLSSGWLSSADETPLNEPIGPNRRLDWIETPLQTIREVKAGLGGTVNDVVLATTAGAVRRFLVDHRDHSDLEIDFRVMAPVSVRSSHSGQLGNHVAMWLVSLPIGEPDPVKRLEAIKEETLRLKRTEQAMGAQTIVAASGGAPHTLVSLGARLATGVRPFNMTVTNVPGPQFPMYLLEAQLISQYPVVPLFHRHGVGIALFSYDGTVAWGINADWDVLPDTALFGEAILESLREMHGVATTSAGDAAPPAVDKNGAKQAATEQSGGDNQPGSPQRRRATSKTKAPAKNTPAKKTTASKTTTKKASPKKTTGKDATAEEATAKPAPATTVAATSPGTAATAKATRSVNKPSGRSSRADDAAPASSEPADQDTRIEQGR